MGTNIKAVIGAVLAAVSFSSFAQCAADAVSVEVLPFTVTHDYSKSQRQLGEIGNGSEVGLVRTILHTRVDGCSATVGWVEPVLMVASELKRNECAFNHVREHELEHVRIYEAAVASIGQRVKDRVADGQSLKDALDREIEAVRAQHRAHDSPDEYALNMTACSGRIYKLAFRS